MNRKKLCFVLALAVLCLVLGMGVYQTQRQYVQMPVVTITLSEGASFYLKDYREAEISISYPDQMEAIVLCAQARQRGNGSFEFDKKSYKIKLDEKADLATYASTDSQAAARDWVLLGEYYDRANLRNYYTFWVAAAFDGFDFVPQGTFVQVYLQGEYQGVYLLCEQVEVDAARVDIDDETTKEKGFLVELTQETTAKQEYTVQVPYQDTVLYFDVRSNVDATQADEDCARIQAVLSAAGAAIATGEQAQIEQVIDIDSCVDMYLLQEFMMNIDVGWGSFYLYCEAGEDVVYFSPPWDFDHAAGMDVRLMEASYEGLYVGSVEAHQMQSNLWYEDLMQQEWFQELVKARWNEQKEVFVQGVAEIRTVAQTYDAQFTENYNMWHTVEEPLYMWPDYGSTYQEDADYLYDWLENRYDWLDDYFNNVM